MFCVHCGTKMHDKARFCPSCGKPIPGVEPVIAEEKIPVESVPIVEEVAPVEEVFSAEPTSPIEEAFAAEPISPIEEAFAEEPVAPIEEAFAEEPVSPIEEAFAEEPSSPIEEAFAAEPSSPIEESFAEEPISPIEESFAEEPISPTEDSYEPYAPAEETPTGFVDEPTRIYDGSTPVIPQSPQPAPTTAPAKSGLAKKNLKSTLIYIISAAVVAGAGFFALPKLAFPAVTGKVAESMSDNGNYRNALAIHKMNKDEDGENNAKFAIAQNELETENYVQAMAYFGELKNKDYDNEQIPTLIDEAFSGRCRVLINAGLYNLAAANATQVSDDMLSTSISNDAYISRAKLISNEGKNKEAYELVRKVDTSAGFDSDSYNIIVYNYAVELYNGMMFEEAYNILEGATDANSVELRKASAYHLGNSLLKEKQYEAAAEMFEKAEDYSDAAEKVKQCNYQLGIRAYNSKHYNDALGFFKKADGYKESKNYIKKIEEKNEYNGWYVDTYVTNGSNRETFADTRKVTPMSRISKNDEFVLCFIARNSKSSTGFVTLEVRFTTSTGVTATNTFENVCNNDYGTSSFSFETPEEGDIGTSTFTVTLVETGEVLDTQKFEIY